MDTERLISIWLALILVPLAVLLPAMIASYVWKLTTRLFDAWLGSPDKSEFEDRD